MTLKLMDYADNRLLKLTNDMGVGIISRGETSVVDGEKDKAVTTFVEVKDNESGTTGK